MIEILCNKFRFYFLIGLPVGVPPSEGCLSDEIGMGVLAFGIILLLMARSAPFCGVHPAGALRILLKQAQMAI